MNALAVKRRSCGFTLIELMVVVALIAVASAAVTLALRDPSATQLEQEAARLAALLESARAEARASGLAVRWEPRPADADASGFRVIGLPPSAKLPQHWLAEGVSAEVVGARAGGGGAEPGMGAPRRGRGRGARRLTLATDGLGAFVVDTR